MNKIIVAAICLFTVVIACKKSSNSTTDSLTLNTVNIAGKYRATDFYVTASGIGYDIYDSVFNPACKKLSINTFTSDGYYTYFDSCNKTTSVPSVYTVVSPNVLYYNGKQYIVQSLTSSQLVIGFDSLITLPQPYNTTLNANFKLTLTKQP